MNKSQFDSLLDSKRDITLDRTPRTLIFGLSFRQEFIHSYVGEDGVVYRHIYKPYRKDFKTISIDEYHQLNRYDVPLLVAPKLCYPEYCDYEFIKIARDCKVAINFTAFEEQRYDETKNKTYFGLTYGKRQSSEVV